MAIPQSPPVSSNRDDLLSLRKGFFELQELKAYSIEVSVREGVLDLGIQVKSSWDIVFFDARLSSRVQMMLQNASNALTFGLETPREPTVWEPTEFSEKLSEYATFIFQCFLMFSMLPFMYARDEQMVLFLILSIPLETGDVLYLKTKSAHYATTLQCSREPWMLCMLTTTLDNRPLINWIILLDKLIEGCS